MTEFNMKLTGQRIRLLRKENKFSQKALAEKIGVAQNTIAQYENGSAKTSIEVLVKLAVVLETSTDYLLGLAEY